MKKKMSFFRFSLNTIDDNIKSYKSSMFVIPATIAIAIWILFASTGLQEAFKSITDLQQMMDVWENGGEALNQYLQPEKSNSSWWEGFTSSFSEEKPQETMSPFVRGLIVNICTIAALVLFLSFMCRYGNGNWRDAITVVGTASLPMTIGMFVGYIFIKIATESTSENIPSIFYSLGAVSMMTSMMTAFIMLYVNIRSILGIKHRTRYYTIILSVFIIMAFIGGLTHYLS